MPEIHQCWQAKVRGACPQVYRVCVAKVLSDGCCANWVRQVTGQEPTSHSYLVEEGGSSLWTVHMHSNECEHDEKA